MSQTPHMRVTMIDQRGDVIWAGSVISVPRAGDEIVVSGTLYVVRSVLWRLTPNSSTAHVEILTEAV